MNARVHVVHGLLAATVFAALGIFWQQRYIRRELESSLDTVTQRRTADDAALRQLAARLREAETQRPELQTAVAKAQKPKAVPSSLAAEHPIDILHRDPAVQVLWLASYRAQVTAAYGPVFRTLGLAPAQIEKFNGIAIRREEQAMDLAATMRTQGLTSNDPAVAALLKQAEDEERAAQLALLGFEGYRQLQDYLRTLPARDFVGALAGAAAVSGTPFSAAQTEQLTRLLAGSSRPYQSGGVADLGSIDWNAVDQQTRAILSAEQFALYQTIEPEGRGGRFSSVVTNAIALARRAEVTANSK